MLKRLLSLNKMAPGFCSLFLSHSQSISLILRLLFDILKVYPPKISSVLYLTVLCPEYGPSSIRVDNIKHNDDITSLSLSIRLNNKPGISTELVNMLTFY